MVKKVSLCPCETRKKNFNFQQTCKKQLGCCEQITTHLDAVKCSITATWTFRQDL